MQKHILQNNLVEAPNKRLDRRNKAALHLQHYPPPTHQIRNKPTKVHNFSKNLLKRNKSTLNWHSICKCRVKQILKGEVSSTATREGAPKSLVNIRGPITFQTINMICPFTSLPYSGTIKSSKSIKVHYEYGNVCPPVPLRHPKSARKTIWWCDLHCDLYASNDFSMLLGPQRYTNDLAVPHSPSALTPTSKELRSAGHHHLNPARGPSPIDTRSLKTIVGTPWLVIFALF